MTTKRILFIVNVGWAFLSHRLPLAVAARKAGYEVHVAATLDPDLDKVTRAKLEAHGFIVHELRLSRSGSHPLELARGLWDIAQIMRRVRPDVTHLVALKPCLLGGIAAKLIGERNVILAVPGRGSVFTAKGLLVSVRRWIALALYALAYRRGSNRVIVQNVEDGQYFVARRVFASEDVRLIRGSGVCVAQFRVQPEPAGIPVVVLASRMLKEKGIQEFVRAAADLKGRGLQARFALVGESDAGNPHSHSREELERWTTEGVVEWWGHRTDMVRTFAESHLVCLPTYYGEGVPKVLIEAAACGRAIVASNIPGCRDITRHGWNGLLVAPRNATALADALEKLLLDPPLRHLMGQRGRALVESEFAVDLVVRQTFDVYAELRA